MTNRLSEVARDVSVLDFGAVGDGVADDTAAIRAAIASGAHRVTIPAGVFLIRNVLEIQSALHLVINGTVRVADAPLHPLVKDAAVGDSEFEIADASEFSVGQWVTLHDEQLPIQGGGRKTRRQNSGNARIVSIEGNRLKLDRSSARSYLREKKAVLARQHGCLWIKHSGVRISGTGTLDGNKSHQLNTAPGQLEEFHSEDWRVSCGVSVLGEGMLSHITIEDITVCDFPMHGICLQEVELSTIRNTTCLRMHDKSITLHRCRDLRVVGNVCCDSEFEDGIMLHKRHTPEDGNYRILIQGNLCKNNRRHGIHVGANMREIHLANNQCIENGMNLSIYGENCTSTGDVAIGTTDHLFQPDVYRPNVLFAGTNISVMNLTALSTRFVGVHLSGKDISLIGGVIGDMVEPLPETDNGGLRVTEGEWGAGSGEFFVRGDCRIGLAFVPDIWMKTPVFPERVRISGVRVRGCRVAVKAVEGAKQLVLESNNFADNEAAADIPASVRGEVGGDSLA